MTTTPDGTSHNSPPKRSWLKKPIVWIGALITAIITGVLTSLATGVTSHIFAAGAAPNIEVDSMTAQYLPGSRTGLPEPMKLDFEIRNTGNQLAIIRAARLTVQQFALLSTCIGQGALISTGTYKAVLPTNPSSGTSLDIPTAQQVGPDEADRFDITLGLPAGRTVGGIYVYRVSIGLLIDNFSMPVNAGEVVIALPFQPDGSFFWSTQDAAQPNWFQRFTFMVTAIPGINRCLISNSHKLRDILDMAGVRPTQLTAVRSQLSFCCGWTLPVVKALQVCGPAVTQPAYMSLSCDGTGALVNMKWSAWTFFYATGTGIYRLQSCTPSCASGKVSSYRVNVRFDMPHPMAKNGWFWDRVTFDFPAGGPDGRSTLVQSNLVPSQ